MVYGSVFSDGGVTSATMLAGLAFFASACFQLSIHTAPEFDLFLSCAMAEASALVACEHDNVVTECWRCRDMLIAMEELKKKKDNECGHHPVVRLWCGCELKKLQDSRKLGGVRVGNKIYKREDIATIELQGESTVWWTVVNLRHGLGKEIFYHDTKALAEAEMKRIQSEM